MNLFTISSYVSKVYKLFIDEKVSTNIAKTGKMARGMNCITAAKKRSSLENKSADVQVLPQKKIALTTLSSLSMRNNIILLIVINM